MRLARKRMDFVNVREAKLPGGERIFVAKEREGERLLVKFARK